MAYSTASLALKVQGGIDNSLPATWILKNTDAVATVDTSGYISDGGKYGMKVGDLVEYYDSNLAIYYTARVVSVSATTYAVDLGDFTSIGSTTNTD